MTRRLSRISSQLGVGLLVISMFCHPLLAQQTFDEILDRWRYLAKTETTKVQIDQADLKHFHESTLTLSEDVILKAASDGVSKLQHSDGGSSNSLPAPSKVVGQQSNENHRKSSLFVISENEKLNKENVDDPTFLQCYADFMAYMSNVKNRTLWALEMLDATGKPGSGLLTGRFMFLGDYDQCTSIVAKYNQTSGQENTPRSFKGRYCSGDFNVNIKGLPAVGSRKWGFCLPDSCSSGDAYVIINMTMKQLNVSLVSFTTMTCHYPQELSARAIGVISLVCFFVLLVIIGTALDIVLIQRPKWRLEAINSLSDEEEKDITNDLGAFSVRGIEDDSAGLLSAPKPVVAEYRPNLPVRLLLAFSAWSNTQRVFNTRQPPGTLKCVNGIRVISISWVILGHCILIASYATGNAAMFAYTYIQRWTFQAIQNATFSVDSFFVMSGLLVSYLSLKEMKRCNGRINWLLFYLHRYLRLTPLYMICMAVYAATSPYWTDGPLYQQQGFEYNYCEDSWWGNVLYVQNLVKFKVRYCFPVAWYLAVDMQFYIVSPLIFVPLFYKPVLGYISAGIFFLGTTITPYVLTLTRYYGPGIGTVKDHPKPLGDRNYDLYIAPYCRMGPYIAGLLLGYVLYRLNGRRLKLYWALNLLGWVVATALALAVLYGLFDYAKGELVELQVAAFYNALSRSAWGLSVTWVIFSCVTGNGGVVNIFLSWNAWVPLSRLTYGAYLIHIILLTLWVAARKTPIYADDFLIVTIFLAALMATYAVSYVAYLFFEAPIIGLEKVLLKKEKRS